MAIHVADVASLTPGAKAAAAVAGGVFTSSSDNALFTYLDASPNTNPVYTELVASGRYDWVAANTLVDWMDSLNDPRMPLYFEQNLGAGIYDGGVYGDNNQYSSFTHVTNSIQVADYKGILMTYSEVEFYLAEAAARGFIAGTPDTHYNTAITASIVDDWGGDTTMANAYLADTNIAWATAPGTYKQKIGLQSWIASYNRGLLGWTTWRRLDYPTLNLPTLSLSPVPTRYTYSAAEQTLNGASYSAAAAAIGGDEQTTKLFWDIY
jgi:hypothetical protein